MINVKLDKILKILAPNYSSETAPKNSVEDKKKVKKEKEEKPAISAGKKEKPAKKAAKKKK